MKWTTLLLVLSVASAREAKLLRYPSYHQGRVAFTHLGDVWTADESGRGVQRLTAHAARDVYPRFSPDGKWIAFSSDREGNLDVFVIAIDGGQAKALTYHTADDSVLGWTPDSRAVLFSSQRGEDFMPRLYTVPVEGGIERNAGADMGVWAGYSPDGKRLAINRKTQQYWRKFYRGSYQSDITVMDLATRKFTDLTDFNGMDAWPMWGRDGFIYFVSDREDKGLSNLWRVPEKGGKAERVTSFTSGDVRWPSISADGKVIVFEHDFGLWKLDVATRKAAQVRVDLAAETQESLSEVRTYSGRADDFDLAPSGRRIAFSIHGEIFTAPVEEGELHQITDAPARDRSVRYSPDGKQVALVSDRDGREEIYVAPVEGGEARRVTSLDSLKSALRWSPDSKEIAFATSDNKLYRHVFDTKETTEISSSRFGPIASPVYSPDGKWIAYSKTDRMRNTEIFLAPVGGGPERAVTFDSYREMSPRFSPDGTKLYFIRFEGTFAEASGLPSAQIHMTHLERLEKDPQEPEERSGDEPADPPAGRRAQAPKPPKEIQIDWDGLKRRTRQITRMPFAVTSFEVAPDGRTLVFVTSEPGAVRQTPVIYSIQDNGRRLTRVATGGAAGEETPPGSPRGGGAFGGGVSGLAISRDGRTVYFEDGGGVWSAPLPQTPAGGGAQERGPVAAAGGGAKRRLNFTAQVKVNKPAEWAQMFGDAWRTMKYRFYDPQMHGRDWDAARAKYQPVVEFVGERQELLNLVNEMIGELNASHTGAAPGQAAGRRVSTGHLGVELEADEQAGRYRVTHVYEEGPADNDWVKVQAGDYLISIDGTPVITGDNYWRLLNHRLNRKVRVKFNGKPLEEGAWETRIEPVSPQAYSQLRYDRWVKQRRELAEKLSGGRVGYVHIQAMNPPSLRKFEKELREHRDKKALIIDERWNGGGNIEQQLLAILQQRQYQLWQPRGTELDSRPFAGYFGPKAVLQNWRSGSNAEMFPAGFRALGLGKVIGTPTVGAVIGTGSYSLIDGSTVRTPQVGVYLADQRQTNMENYGVQPDIFVENTPEDNLAGKDRQLETAVSELVKELDKKGPR